MTNKTKELINKLADKCINLKQPIHVIAVCTGGRQVGKQIHKYFHSKNIESSYHEVWTNIINGKANVWKTNFKKNNYIGTILLAEDAIWIGRSINAAKRAFLKIKKRKIYVASLLDYNKKGDFSMFN